MKKSDFEIDGKRIEEEYKKNKFVYLQKAKGLLSTSNRTIENLSENLKVPVSIVEEIIDDLVYNKYNIIQSGNKYQIVSNIPMGATKLIDLSRFNNIKYKIGFVTDTHLNSKYSRLDVLNAIYDIFEKEGVKEVYHAGNFVDGECRFNKYDLINTGVSPQIEYFLEKYPQRKGIVTKFIAGDDHEGWWVQREKINIGEYTEMKAKQAKRNDLEYLGYLEADVVFKTSRGKCVMKVMHPGGGTAYALSYTPQKIVESFTGGEKPNILLIGHYHKADYLCYRNVHIVQGGCFTGNTKILTETGYKKIKDIKVGDSVLTHKDRYKKVTELMKPRLADDFIKINYGRLNRSDQTITCTSEHPILVEHNGKKEWVRADEIKKGDLIFVVGGKCELSGETIPYYLNYSKNVNPMDNKKTRDKLSKTKGGFKKVRNGESSGAKHLLSDILPYCNKLIENGFRVVPVGADVIPDIIAFKDGKVYAYEVESARGNLLDYKKKKYETSLINKYIDEVRWVDCGKERVEQPRSYYDIDKETGFVKVKVISARHVDFSRRKRKQETVYNFSVEDDNSYIAGGVVVHNCTQDQTPFMRKKKLQAHVGGWILDFELSQDGAINRFKSEWLSFYDKDYYKRNGYYR